MSDENAPEEINNVTIPSWVIYFVVLLFAVSVFGFVFFHRYTKSVHNYKLALSVYQEGDIAAAEEYITKASDLVPENKDFLAFKYFISGINRYTQKNYEEALKLLNQYKEYNRGDSYIDQLTATIEISNAFEAKDYAQMVELASELYSDYSEDPRVILQYASALSCEYAATDNIDDFNKSRELIEEALKYELDDSNVDYLNRIEYRLNTKKIISADEYHQLEKEGKL